MPPDLMSIVQWPGVTGVLSCEGAIGHGISPSTFLLRTILQISNPAPFGDLVLGDGVHPPLVLRGCKLFLLTGSAGEFGQTLELEIQDRRWRWQGLGAVDGRWNRSDANGKAVAWSLRSPVELAQYCLDALGETNYAIDLPIGLTRSDGADLDRYLRLGENFPQSLANPPLIWDRTPPAQALARLCEFFGRRVVYQPFADRFIIARPGIGDDLPDGPSEMIAPSVKVPATPSGVGVAGAPIRFQARFLLEACGREWDGSIQKINDLSYAPRAVATRQVSGVTWTGPVAPDGLQLTFTWIPLAGGPMKRAVVRDTDSGHTTIAARWAAIIAAIQSNPDMAGLCLATAGGNTLTLTGVQIGQGFTVYMDQIGVTGAFAVNVAIIGRPGGGDWSTCPPPSFASVRPTERLSYIEARSLAQGSAFRMYRIRNVDCGTGKAPMRIPWYKGEIRRRQQILLQPSKPSQVVPQARIEGGINKGGLLPEGQLTGGVLPESYNGYSRDSSPYCFGAISRFIGSVFWIPRPADGGDGFNTLPTDRVFIDFTVDPIEQTITFAEPVYLSDMGGGGWVAEPQLVLETGCIVCDVDNDNPVRWLRSIDLGGNAPVEWQVCDDIQIAAVGQYDDKHNLTGFTLIGDADAEKRAQYYLDGMTIPYQLSAGLTRSYPGIWGQIDPSGLIQQVSFAINEGGGTTTASANCEHSPIVPPYPARRLKENLPPNKAAAAANLAERNQIDKIFPRPGGSVQ